MEYTKCCSFCKTELPADTSRKCCSPKCVKELQKAIWRTFLLVGEQRAAFAKLRQTDRPQQKELNRASGC